MEPIPTGLPTATPQNPDQAPATDDVYHSNQIAPIYIVAIVAGIGWAIILLMLLVKIIGFLRQHKADPERGEGQGPGMAPAPGAKPSAIIRDDGFVEISLNGGVGMAQTKDASQPTTNDPNHPDFYASRRAKSPVANAMLGTML
ncbi:hypothetical protein F5Y14DRAFT_457359 [Nemania sp. NC0429]|nr:hypothetical protein F5Y14DRAFT_457359 [Nemania sp. NC0429]